MRVTRQMTRRVTLRVTRFVTRHVTRSVTHPVTFGVVALALSASGNWRVFRLCRCLTHKALLLLKHFEAAPQSASREEFSVASDLDTSRRQLSLVDASLSSVLPGSQFCRGLRMNEREHFAPPRQRYLFSLLTE